MQKILLLILLVVCGLTIHAQRTTLRGNVYEKDDGNTVIAATVAIQGANIVTLTDENGFFNFVDPPSGLQSLVVTYIGYDTTIVEVNIAKNGITYQRVYMEQSSTLLQGVEITSAATTKRTEVKAGAITVSPKQIKSLPSIGGDADIAQYLPVLPGIISTGDQGGQIYIRGGAPVQNKIMIDGMTIFNPFHSIGLFSVFETEAIQTVDVLSAGYNVEHGGRMSAVVDINTKDGNKNRLSGVVGVSPFNGKVVLEGPIVKLDESREFSSSFLLTAKKSLLEHTSKQIYKYVNEDGLPFAFEDYYGKVNFSLGNGSKIDLFGFNFTDNVKYTSGVDFNWKNFGAGANFTLNPVGSAFTLNGTVNYTNYNIALNEVNNLPRTSGLSNYMVGVNIVNYGARSELRLGVELAGYTTDLEYTNFLKHTIVQNSNTSELAFYIKDKFLLGDLVLEPGFRLHYYTALGKVSPEPRIGMKYNVNDKLRLKAAGGLYSQNILSTVDDRDVVNLFNGFLTGPEESVFDYSINDFRSGVIQRATHGVFGIEYDVNNYLEVNVEPYFKRFNTLLNLNRGKALATDPNYLIEVGDAYGIDLSAKYSRGIYYLWATYSYGKVNRDDGRQVYPTIYDRTHNINLLGSVALGRDKSFELSMRFNFGSGFPFTRALGFYNLIPSTNLDTDFISANGTIGVLYETERNKGRLSDYHRLDFAAKKTFNFSKRTKLEINASVSNVYNRDNIFYFNRISYERVNQLPILPSAGVNFYF